MQYFLFTPLLTNVLMFEFSQLVEKDQEGAILWFWKAINSRDRIDSALKDMAVVMKQQDRAEEAVEAIKSFRHLCSKQAQESLDNVLIDLYKKCGMVEEQIDLLKQKLKLIYLGEAFNGKTTKKARSHGKKFQVSIKQETSRILGNLGWTYMQQDNYMAAEAVYRKAQEIEPDANKACNLGLCLLRQGRCYEAWSVLEQVRQKRMYGSDDAKVVVRLEELLDEIERNLMKAVLKKEEEKEIMLRVELPINDHRNLAIGGGSWPTRRLPIFQKLSTMSMRETCAFS